MAGTDKRKQSLYFPEDMLREIQEEANRQDRSLSWIVQQAWKIARNEIMRFPSVNDVIGGEGRGTPQEREESCPPTTHASRAFTFPKRCSRRSRPRRSGSTA